MNTVTVSTGYHIESSTWRVAQVLLSETHFIEKIALIYKNKTARRLRTKRSPHVFVMTGRTAAMKNDDSRRPAMTVTFTMNEDFEWTYFIENVEFCKMEFYSKYVKGIQLTLKNKRLNLCSIIVKYLPTNPFFLCVLISRFLHPPRNAKRTTLLGL